MGRRKERGKDVIWEERTKGKLKGGKARSSLRRESNERGEKKTGGKRSVGKGRRGKKKQMREVKSREEKERKSGVGVRRKKGHRRGCNGRRKERKIG